MFCYLAKKITKNVVLFGRPLRREFLEYSLQYLAKNYIEGRMDILKTPYTDLT